MRMAVFSSDPLYKYHQKGEVKPRYWNPRDMFDEVLVFTFCRQDVEPGKVQQLAGSARLEVIPLGPPNPLRLQAQYRHAVDRLAGFGPDLVRVHNPWHAGLVGIRAARRLRIPVVLSLHTHYAARRQWERRWLLYPLALSERWSVRQADCVLCVSHHVAEYARGMGARRIEVIYNRVYADQFHCARSGFGDPPVVLSVGRLDPPKDQECLIRAVQGMPVELHLVGDGVNRGALDSLVRSLGMAGQVRFWGAVPHDRIQTHYARADLFAMATHYEGFCIPVLEAMASGLPVVAGNTPPIPELLAGEGLVVPHTPSAFRQALRRLLDDQESAMALGRRARCRAFGLDGSRMEDREMSLYRSLSGPGAGLSEGAGTDAVAPAAHGVLP